MSLRLISNAGFGSIGRGMVAAFRKVAFSSHKAALAAKKEANYCWCDSYRSFNIRSNDSSYCSSEDLELEEGFLPLKRLEVSLLSSLQHLREV